MFKTLFLRKSTKIYYNINVGHPTHYYWFSYVSSDTEVLITFSFFFAPHGYNINESRHEY